MEWSRLSQLINLMTKEEQNTDVAILLNDEIYSGTNSNFLINLNLLDQLDHGHPYLDMNL